MRLPPTVIEKLEELKLDLRQIFRSPISDVYREIDLLSADQEHVYSRLNPEQLQCVWSDGMGTWRLLCVFFQRHVTFRVLFVLVQAVSECQASSIPASTTHGS